VAHTQGVAPSSGKYWVILRTQKTKRQTEPTLKTKIKKKKTTHAQGSVLQLLD